MAAPGPSRASARTVSSLASESRALHNYLCPSVHPSVRLSGRLTTAAQPVTLHWPFSSGLAGGMQASRAPLECSNAQGAG